MFGKKRREGQAAAASAAHLAFLAQAVEQAKSYEGVVGAEAAGATPLPLKANERLLLCIQGAALIEPRHAAGHWEGRSSGVSVPVPGLSRVRYRVGATHGTYVQGAEVPTPIDTGSFTITTTRAVFVGPKQTREWAWSKLLGITHSQDPPWSAISVSNRQKTSGVLYDAAHADQIRFTLDLAIAIVQNDRATLVAHLTEELNAARVAPG